MVITVITKRVSVPQMPTGKQLSELTSVNMFLINLCFQLLVSGILNMQEISHKQDFHKSVHDITASTSILSMSNTHF